MHLVTKATPISYIIDNTHPYGYETNHVNPLIFMRRLGSSILVLHFKNIS